MGLLDRLEDPALRRLGVLPNETRLERLDALKATPRVVNAELYSACGKPPLLLGRSKWKRVSATMPLVYAAVAHAHEGLYCPGPKPRHAAVVFTLDEARATDVAFISGVAQKVKQAMAAPEPQADARHIVSLLRDCEQVFVEALPLSLTSGIEVFCSVIAIDPPKQLPRRYLPTNGILPAFVREQPIVGVRSGLSLVLPAAYI